MTDNPNQGKGDWNIVVMGQIGFLSHFGHAFAATLPSDHLLQPHGQYNRSLASESPNSALGKL